MYIKFNEGKFTSHEVTEHAIDDLRNGNGPTMVIMCATPFEGTPDELSVLAVEYLNKMYQINRSFNFTWEHDGDVLNKNKDFTWLRFQMCNAGF